MQLAGKGFYTFQVDKNATKPLVAKKVADKFNVKVLKVKMVNIKGVTKSQKRVRKFYRTTGFKKAIVQIAKDQKIAIFEAPKEEVAVTTAESEPMIVKEKKDILRRTKVKVERGATGAAPTTQRKVITGK
ncbi:50S ribosomal protein L23 [Candidatus Daviesbacteria bacterium]|nr:50S ribosomal protein L23 [Candidatus Daviesbacteria bacterium]